jgi:hypothetical protein
MFSLDPLGFHAREAGFDRWVETHGNFDCIRRSHAWHAAAGSEHHHATATETHTPATLIADLRCDHFDAECCCVGDLIYRGACLGCGWEGEPCEDENTAAEDAHDHAWPGWRQLPVVARCPPQGPQTGKQNALSGWLERVDQVYPVGWISGGGPIRTRRDGIGTRHVPLATPFGGWDLAANGGRTR